MARQPSPAQRVARWRARKRAKAREPVAIEPGARARIIRNEVWAKLRTTDKGARELASRLITYYPEGFQHMPKYRSGKWDGRIRLLRRNGIFPGGLSDRVMAALREQGVDVSFEDRSEPPWVEPQLAGGTNVTELRPYQLEALQRAQDARRGVFEAATGTGKTEIMGELIRRLQGRALILVAQRDLAWQTIERFQGSLTFPHARDRLYGIVGDNEDSPGLITAALYQTLHERVTPVCLRCGERGEREWETCGRILGKGKRCDGRLDFDEVLETEEWLASFDSLHLDEAHRSPAKTWWPIVQACPAYYRFGYSATPFKSNRETELKLVGATGEVVYSFPARQAIDEGYLTPPYVIFVKSSFKPFEEYSYMQAYKDGIVEHDGRNKLIAEITTRLVRDWKVPTLVLVKWHAQGYDLLRRLRHERIEAEYVSGRADTDERKLALRALESGKLGCIIGTTIFDEGINAPRIGALVLAGGGKARHKQLQRIGRGLRLVEGKEYLAVFDFVDDHGFTDRRGIEEPGVLAEHSHERLLAVKNADFDHEVLTATEVLARMDAGDIRKAAPGRSISR